ncbi:hypothetical protein D8B26_002647 [Coccidioides posadasii str. Silveira]|uniref:Uncharacterized protein n=3 Tax=Coccidioides posadasii TaxID=199306 RepID=E9CYR6_COCPS|nr:hypothetical protein CPC735_023550 [Coccidioides posadasii C735 delta SOWgp]EER27019.1 hypothetical protein CPC735_023550 [Coccidioides posadasii C735 delta SOWgp]EFW21093.1 conserved hypothetical protein [Coccidioides posadasii str. Silveira]KMM66692.1 hypothetical protein CPAG_03030 [Coccidioides posadasii RMSCC 3488]QVM07950.1 hypothetical protein D8B26_002647 [Coccidioides posadasii str. Silveira]|eukprot:XP_003069164.1 hypothetical protein CPC735_023550 [Coccidioides posadasii C735 delta SOWgp]
MRLKNIFNPNYTDQNWRKPLAPASNPLALEEISLQSTPGEHAPNPTSKGSQHHEEPVLRKRHAATAMELFFDLFFVANLGSFTSTHDINTVQNLKSYIGYITILWFYWFQTVLFDLRFHSDSILSRIFTGMHLGVMTGFAVLAPNFDTTDPLNHPRRFRNMGLLLMVSRLVLVLQYAIVAWYIRGYKKTLSAKIMTTGILFASAMVFLALAVTTQMRRGRYAYLGWYIVPAIEALAMVSISSIWKVLSFKGTPIVERFGGMTLIVLGEGTVGMTKAVTSIAKGTSYPTASSIILITCYIIILYFMYMIYFDQTDENRFGYIRQQIWAIFHFPLHMSILITSEGSRAFVLYSVAKGIYETAFKHSNASKVSETTSQVVDTLKLIVHNLRARLRNTQDVPDLNYIYNNITAIENLEADSEKLGDLIAEFTGRLFIWIMRSFGIDATPQKSTSQKDSEQLAKLTDKLFLVFRFFFIAAGLVLIFMAVLHWFSKSHKSRGEVLSIITTTTIGIGLSLTSIMALYDEQDGESAFYYYLNSGWIVPTVTLAYALVVAIDNSIIVISHKRRIRYVAQAYRQVP